MSLVVSGCADTPEPGMPTVSISIEAIGEPAVRQAAMVEERFIHLLNQHIDNEFRIVKGITSDGTSIRGTIERIHRDTQRLQVDLVLESQGRRDTIQRDFNLDRQTMQQLALLIRDKLKLLATSTRTVQSRVRTRRRPVVILSNHPGTLEVYAGRELVDRKRLPGSELPVSISLDGTKGYRFVAVPFDTISLNRWASVSGNYWPPQDTLVIVFSK